MGTGTVAGGKGNPGVAGSDMEPVLVVVDLVVPGNLGNKEKNK